MVWDSDRAVLRAHIALTKPFLGYMTRVSMASATFCLLLQSRCCGRWSAPSIGAAASTKRRQHWLTYAVALLFPFSKLAPASHALCYTWLQAMLPFKSPARQMRGVEQSLAFTITALIFVTNTNWPSYVPETR